MKQPTIAVTKVCKLCGKEFVTNYPHTKYCSPECAAKKYRELGNISSRERYKVKRIKEKIAKEREEREAKRKEEEEAAAEEKEKHL